MIRFYLALACVVLAAVHPGLARQSESKLSLSGTVVNSVTGAPVPNARVELPPQVTRTDATGSFHFSGLRPDDYQLLVQKPGYVVSNDGSLLPVISLTSSLENYVYKLVPTAVVRGRVTDDSGEPVQGATAEIWQSQVLWGTRQMHLIAVGEADDRGEYKLTGLAPGRYLVKVSRAGSHVAYYGDKTPMSGLTDAFVPTYFGGSQDAAAASVVTVEAGTDQRADVTVSLVAGHAIRGRLLNFKPHMKPRLQLVSGENDLGRIAVSLEYATGRFEIRGVPDGSYFLRALQSGEGDQSMYGELGIQVSGTDVDGITLGLAPLPALRGTTQSETPDGTVRAMVAVRLLRQGLFFEENLEPAEGSERVADGKFEVPSVTPGRYWIRFPVTPPVAYVASAHAGNSDLLATQQLDVSPSGAPEIEVVLRTDGGVVTGTLEAAGTKNAKGFAILVPESCNRPAEYTRFDNGEFAFYMVAPGPYRMYAWQSSAGIEYGSPRELCALANDGLHVDVAPGGNVKVRLSDFSKEPK